MPFWERLFNRPKKATHVNSEAITASIDAAKGDVDFADKYARMTILNSFEQTASCAEAEADIQKRARGLRKRSHARLQTISETAEQAVAFLAK